jgi:putative transposase
LNREFQSSEPNQKWTSDISYLICTNGTLYLAVILDLFRRKVISYRLDTNMRAELVLQPMKEAIRKRKLKKGLLFHSDRGIQYACNEFQQLLKKHGVISSMSQKEDCWDNAVTESFFGTLKSELMYKNRHHTIEETKLLVFEYIETYYNKKRLHSFPNYSSLVEFEKSWSQTSASV